MSSVLRIGSGSAPWPSDGDRDFRRLYDQFAGELLPYIEGKLGPCMSARYDAEDILQQTLQEILSAMRRGHEPIKNLPAYAKTCARNIIAFYARRKSIHFVPLPPGDRGTSSGFVPGPRIEPRQQKPEETDPETRELVQRAIESLEPEERLVIRLRFYSGPGRRPTADEIAQRIGKSRFMAEKILAGAKAKVRRFLMRHKGPKDSRFYF
jgi:RNA polymerase sigma factor (sigma-70 family)